MNLIHSPVSFGEFIDKMTILEIKAERIDDKTKLANVRHELEMLNKVWSATAQASIDISVEKAELKKINEKLWEIEDDIRIKESEATFDAGFIGLARSVYITNDERAAIKCRINHKLGSELMEEKSYVDYRPKT